MLNWAYTQSALLAEKPLASLELCPNIFGKEVKLRAAKEEK